jgi:hypothetical protein
VSITGLLEICNDFKDRNNFKYSRVY